MNFFDQLHCRGNRICGDNGRTVLLQNEFQHFPRIGVVLYNENLPAEDRVPACVSTCPASARHFGDLGDPASAVSQMVAARGGYDLMPEMGYAPTNKYLPPRPHKDSAGCTGGLAELAPAIPAGSGGLLGWIDQLLSR